MYLQILTRTFSMGDLLRSRWPKKAQLPKRFEFSKIAENSRENEDNHRKPKKDIIQKKVAVKKFWEKFREVL